MAKVVVDEVMVDEFCPICGEFIEVRCTGVKRKPFVDGKNYEVICFCCFSVPKLVDFDPSQGWIHYEYLNPALHEIGDLIKYGWDKETATRSYKAVKRLLKKKKPLVAKIEPLDQPPASRKAKKPIYENEDFSEFE